MIGFIIILLSRLLLTLALEMSPFSGKPHFSILPIYRASITSCGRRLGERNTKWR